MAVFQELIKDFEKIRGFARDFLIYGIRSRNNQTLKSKRSYDNEKRRIEGILPKYFESVQMGQEKKICLSLNLNDLQKNPLYNLWETKSFSKNDLLLHFCLLDLFEDENRYTVQEVYDLYLENYLSNLDNQEYPDLMTIRNKLNTYVTEGIFSKEKISKQIYYKKNNCPFDCLSPKEIDEVVEACNYYELVLPLGFLGNQIQKRFMTKKSNLFSFKQAFIYHALDEDIALNLFKAIKEHRQVILFQINRRNSKIVEKKGIPLKIGSSARHGRQYIYMFNPDRNMYFSSRLDLIQDIKLLNIYEDFDNCYTEFLEKSKKSWGVYFEKLSKPLERLELTLSIDETKESYVLERLLREGKHGVVEKIDSNLFTYIIEVVDTVELFPWLRTFIGRIVKIEGSNQNAIKRFKLDINAMYYNLK